MLTINTSHQRSLLKMATELNITMDQDTVNCSYVPGSIVNGTFTVEVNKPKHFRQIRVYFQGRSRVLWTESGSRSGDGIYQSNEIFADNMVILWSSGNSPSGTLPAGRHTYPFQFTLPTNCPSSYSSVVGNIRYWVAGVVLTHQLKVSHNVEHPFSVLNLTSVNGPNWQRPVRAQNQKTIGWWFCKSGQVTVNAKVERSGFNVGEEIPLSFNVENGSGRRITVRCELVEIVKYKGSSGYQDKQIPLINHIGIVYSEPINPHTITGQQFVQLLIPNNLRPAITRSSIIKSVYSVNVTLVIPWADNLTIYLPVVIGNATANSLTNQS